jgi:SH3 domain-containing YSC84-like protein 1
MRKLISALLMMVLAASPLLTGAVDTKNRSRLENCGMVMDEILRVPDDIPARLMDKAECVIVIPSVLKGAFIVGGSYGRGAMTCRSGKQFDGKWSAPSMMALEGGSFGFQLGAQATDFVFLVPTNRSSRVTHSAGTGSNASSGSGLGTCESGPPASCAAG